MGVHMGGSSRITGAGGAAVGRVAGVETMTREAARALGPNTRRTRSIDSVTVRQQAVPGTGTTRTVVEARTRAGTIVTDVNGWNSIVRANTRGAVGVLRGRDQNGNPVNVVVDAPRGRLREAGRAVNRSARTLRTQGGRGNITAEFARQ